MAAPSGTVWGSIVGSYGKIGIYTSLSSDNTTTTITTQIWFWSKYSVSDTSNTLYYTFSSSSSSATDSKGSVSISTSVSSGSGWSTSNQVKLYEYTHAAISRSTSAGTRYLYAKLTNIDKVGGTMYVDTTVTIPALASYKITYNANGGTISSKSSITETKYYGKNYTISTTKPTRSGYTFLGWSTSSTATSANSAYDPGDTYSTNAALSLYAVWKEITYTITYNANGGTISSKSSITGTKYYTKSYTIITTVPVRSGYTFLGWSTSSTATSANSAYDPGDTYSTNAALTLYAVWELAYTKPRITGYSVARCDSDSTKSDEGTCALVAFTWTCDYEVSSVVIAWGLSTSSALNNSRTISTSGTSGSVSKLISDFTFSTESTYTFQITVADSNGSTTIKKTLTSISYVIDFKAGGKGIAFGKAAELDGYVDSTFKMNLQDHVYLANNKTIYGKATDGTTNVNLIYQNSKDNVIVGYGSYEHELGQTRIYGYDVEIGVANIATPDTYRPYRRQGDTITLTIRTSGYVTNSGTDVYFWIPMAEPIVGGPTTTITSGNGFIFRQNNKYTHGSAASTYVIPTSYTATATYCNGILVQAVFSDTTNVTNNDTIGIYWNGTITFS